MKPFNVTPISNELFFSYPSSDDFIKVSSSLSADELAAFIRAKVIEYIPYAFQDHPLVYETMRNWIAKEISINASEIIVIGSAKTGFSMAPPPDFGKNFSPNSDLDLTIISNTIFEPFSNLIETWRKDYESGKETPKNKTEEHHWKSNLARLPNNIKNGFIDTNKFPNRYSASSKINNLLWRLNTKLKATDKNLEFRKCSLRVYKDWNAFSRQFMLNMNSSFSKLKNVI